MRGYKELVEVQQARIEELEAQLTALREELDGARKLGLYWQAEAEALMEKECTDT
jgi:hypothetical protein